MGFIYILTNPSFPDYVKIGYADDVEQRLKQLNATECTPYAFHVYATYEVGDRLLDKEIHKVFDILSPACRAREVNQGKERVREFFAISAEDAFAVLESMAKIHGSIDKLQKLSMSDNEQMDVVEAKEIARKREAKNFQFSMCNINVGEEIVFVGCTKNAKDNDTYGTHVVIANDKQVEYDDKLWSLSALAKELGGNYAYGAGNFEYKEENLNAIRARLGK